MLIYVIGRCRRRLRSRRRGGGGGVCGACVRRGRCCSVAGGHDAEIRKRSNCFFGNMF